MHLFFGRRQRLGLSLLPCHLEESHTRDESKNKEVTRVHAKAKEHSRELIDLRPGERVWIQHHQTKDWYKQATIIQSRHNDRVYELVDDDGKTYYRGRRFLRPATVFRCYTNETEESTEPAMESDKPTYTVILSRDRKAPTTSDKTDVNVNIWLHCPRSVPIQPSDRPKERTSIARLPTDCHREQLLNLHDQKTTATTRCIGSGWC